MRGIGTRSQRDMQVWVFRRTPRFRDCSWRRLGICMSARAAGCNPMCVYDCSTSSRKKRSHGNDDDV